MKITRRNFITAGSAALAGSAPLLTGFSPLRGQTASTEAADNSSAGPYTPVVTPNGTTMPWTMKDGVKEFHIVAEPVKREFAPGMVVNCWGYNGQTPGPTIEAVEGDRVRFVVSNKLPEPTTIHWHGLLLPNGMDGVAGLTQPAIQPGETYEYEFTLRQHGTQMYHPHADEMVQMALGMVGFFIIHPKERPSPRIDRDFAIFLAEWAIDPGTATPNPNVMLDFNTFTLNSRAYPGTEPLVTRLHDRVRIRVANLSAWTATPCTCTATNSSSPAPMAAPSPLHRNGHSLPSTCRWVRPSISILSPTIPATGRSIATNRITP